MRYHLFGAVFTACLVFTLGVATAQIIPIDDVQVYNPDGTIDLTAPYYGQIITVEGVIYVVNQTYNNGSHYIQGDTGGIAFYHPAAPVLTYGDRVQVTGLVDEFSGEIQIENVTNVTFLGAEASPDSVEVEIAQLVNSTVNPERYEWVGNFIYCIGTVTSKGSNNFYLKNAADDSIQVYLDSDADIDIENVDEGDQYKVISPCVNFNQEIELKPRRQTDLIEDPFSDLFPTISNVNCTSWVPASGDPIEVTAIITDDNTVASAELYYRDDNGDSTGAFTPVSMVNVGGDTYSGTIPAPHPERQVDFYISATDNILQTTTNPGNAPAGWREIAIGFTPIYTMQYVHPDTFSHVTPYLNRVLNVQGIVTAGTGQAGPASRFVLQEEDPSDVVPQEGGDPITKPDFPAFAGPDYRWGGVLVYEGTGSNFVFEGDFVQVGGRGEEYFNLTEMEPHNGSAVYIVSFGNDLPYPMYASTRNLADAVFMDDGNGRYGEAFESCWVRTKAAAVMDTLDFGVFIISDTGARADSVEVDPETSLSYEPILGDFIIVEGFMDYEFGAFQVTPTADNYIVSGLVGVDDLTPEVLQPAGGFTAVAPNPFNPKAQIRFLLTRENLTQLNIYDIRGNLVRTLVNEVLPAQEHVYFWDGTDGTGQPVASGTYFARLRISSEVMQIRKLSLVK